MGNSVHGQSPSIVFELIRNNILNPVDKHKFNISKYDFLKEMELLVPKERVYYELALECQCLRLKGDNKFETCSKEFVKAARDVHNLLVKLELSDCSLQEEESEESDESNKVDESKNDEKSKDDEPTNDKKDDESNETSCHNEDNNGPNENDQPNWLLRLECDTRSLDLAYGLLQLEMAVMLLGEIELTDAEQNDFTGKNNKVFSLIKEKWQNLTTEEKSARTMQSKAVQKVEPCREALQNWWNWGIL